jgi:type I restriction enzyme, S subunit
MDAGSVLVKDLVARGEAELTTGPFGTQLKAAEYVASGIPVINVRNVGFGNIRADNLEFISDSTADRLNRHRLQAGDIVFGRKGAVERHGFVRDVQTGWLQGSDCLRLRLRSPQFNPRFVSYFLLTDHHKQWMINYCSHGATMASLNQDILGRIDLPLRPRPEQDRIVAVLSAYDELIEHNMRRIQILEEMAQAIYREWFVGLRFPGHKSVPFVDSDLGPIPEGWEVSTAAEALDVSPKVRVDRHEVKPFVPMTSISERHMHIDPIEERAGSSGARYRNGDTLFARITPCLENGKTAFVQFLAQNDAGCGSTEFIVLRGHQVTAEFTYLLARSEPFRNHAIASMSGATGRQRVRSECFDSYKLVVPPRPLNERFTAVVRPMFELSYRLFVANKNLRTTRDLLLPRLISGEIDVSSLDIDVEGAVA